MTEQELTAHLAQWSRNLEQRIRAEGKPFHARTVTTQSYHRSCAKYGRYAGRQVLNSKQRNEP